MKHIIVDPIMMLKENKYQEDTDEEYYHINADVIIM